MKIKSVQVQGVAVHTRAVESGKDYDWYFKRGQLQLFEKIDQLYRLALRDIGGEEIPKLALIIESSYIGFLITDLPTPRFDHANRVIYDTLYLEFDQQWQQDILSTLATLLLCSKNTYLPHQQHFMEYAEMLLMVAAEQSIAAITLPVLDKQPDSTLTPITQEKLVLFSNLVNRHRCATYLKDLKIFSLKSGFMFLSTGRLNLKKCRTIADTSEQCLILTLSSEVVHEINLASKPLGKLDRLKQFIGVS
jgi:hypothetical protein